MKLEHELRRQSPLQVWLLTAISMVAIICATILLVWCEGRLFSSSEKNYVSKIILWAVKALTQESEMLVFMLSYQHQCNSHPE